MSNNWISYSNFFDIVGLKAVFSNRNTLSNEGVHDRIVFSELIGLNPKNLVIPKQTHSSNYFVCESPGNYPDTDAVISINKHVVLSMQVADCIPIFIVDIEKKYTALIHAGWRGLVTNIIQKTIKQMFQHGCETKNIKIVLGPSIKSCCFEVSDDVIHQFSQSIITRNRNKKGKYWVDLLALAKKQLSELSINDANIYVDQNCTSCEIDHFHSYRRDGMKAGRMLALIGWV
ncbi:MAG: peptidoglycan editing factor PgeF [Candidatus Marinimicrobia bacterium]|jgi:hypothetical protein|nr:peptidoglycan editing factor PgeF [Candidatus Neomarinimicrobiota bacterium]MBT3936725.1 peptidoglycan editing factor PgeF [Candidatus Neomarinimicrobiota bacterium]MBT3960558.1 peptidoglycan editing factor PgeF [Candidatus Neomarinimicrobiota bacterium]MBT4382495.1 peptidoglycan editing factor PgeF [Candidatus Neomarinimicrobiota bacterium]MBT4637014.1 peptidoglycan editing factor PgeF [Candidatus Neomarinimicrobiota bacterium]